MSVFAYVGAVGGELSLVFLLRISIVAPDKLLVQLPSYVLRVALCFAIRLFIRIDTSLIGACLG